MILAVNIDEPQAEVRAYTEELSLTFPTLLDAGGTVAQSYGVRGVPTSVFIDRQGMIRYRQTGPLDASLIDTHLTPLL